MHKGKQITAKNIRFTPNIKTPYLKIFKWNSIEMEVGDMLVFTDKTVHSSHSNKGPYERKSIVLGVRHNTKEFDNKVYEDATNYRRKFLCDELQKVINKTKGVNMYQDFNQNKR